LCIQNLTQVLQKIFGRLYFGYPWFITLAPAPKKFRLSVFHFFDQNWSLYKGRGKCRRFFGDSGYIDFFSDSIINGLSTIFLSGHCRRYWLLPCQYFQLTLFFEIRILVTWLKSKILKIECFDTTMYNCIWKHNVYKQMRWSIIFERKSFSSWERKGEVLALIKSLIYERVKNALGASYEDRPLKLWAENIPKEIQWRSPSKTLHNFVWFKKDTCIPHCCLCFL